MQLRRGDVSRDDLGEEAVGVRSAIVAIAFALGACAEAPSPTGGPAPRFYTGRDYGSEAQFNPLSEIVNEGFDITQSNDQDRHVFKRDYAIGAHNVWESVLHAPATWDSYGVSRAARNEWFPLTTANSTGGGAWVPNYEYHLIGSGMVSVRMAEWYAQHGASHSVALSVATLMTAHFINEVLENGVSRTANEDAVTDLLIFDPAGILLWRVDAVQRLFSGPLQLTNWPGQPSIDIASGTLENVGQQFVLRARLPGTTHWMALYDFGLSTLAGLSYEKSNGDAISVAAGVDAIANPVVDAQTGAKGATLRFKGGVFYDRKGSLLGSLQVGSRNDDAVVNVNIYPAVLGSWRHAPGVWLQVPRAGGVRFGLASRWGIGIGHGPER